MDGGIGASLPCLVLSADAGRLGRCRRRAKAGQKRSYKHIVAFRTLNSLSMSMIRVAVVVVVVMMQTAASLVAHGTPI